MLTTFGFGLDPFAILVPFLILSIGVSHGVQYINGWCNEVTENGLDVKIIGTDLVSFIKKVDLSRDRAEQRPERYNVGDKVDGAITAIDRTTKKVGVSIKALEMAEEKEAIAQFGSSDSGASLGDILGAALKKAGEKK